VALKIAPQEATSGDFQKCLEQLHIWWQKYIVAEESILKKAMFKGISVLLNLKYGSCLRIL
jgi:hypothetical protein